MREKPLVASTFKLVFLYAIDYQEILAASKRREHWHQDIGEAKPAVMVTSK